MEIGFIRLTNESRSGLDKSRAYNHGVADCPTPSLKFYGVYPVVLGSIQTSWAGKAAYIQVGVLFQPDVPQPPTKHIPMLPLILPRKHHHRIPTPHRRDHDPPLVDLRAVRLPLELKIIFLGQPLAQSSAAVSANSV